MIGNRRTFVISLVAMTVFIMFFLLTVDLSFSDYILMLLLIGSSAWFGSSFYANFGWLNDFDEEGEVEK